MTIFIFLVFTKVLLSQNTAYEKFQKASADFNFHSRDLEGSMITDTSLLVKNNMTRIEALVTDLAGELTSNKFEQLLR